MQVVRRVLIERAPDSEIWIALNEYKYQEGDKVIRDQLHIMPNKHTIFKANDSEERREFLIYNYDNIKEWHEESIKDSID